MASFGRLPERVSLGLGLPLRLTKQKAIGIAELWSLRDLSAKHVELLAKD
jgi:hypothetical protein